MALTAKEIMPQIPKYSLKSLVFAQMLMPKFPMTKIFKPRRIIADSRGLTESKDMYRRAFEADWLRLSKKKAFFTNDLNVTETFEIDWIKRAIIHHYPIIFSSYLYYACTGGGDSFTMSEGEFRKCLYDVKMVAPMSNKSQSNDVREENERLHNEVSIIFVKTNIEERVDPTALKNMAEEETKNTEAAQQHGHNLLNPDRGLMRFEYLEALLRLAAYHWNINNNTLTFSTKNLKEMPDAFNNIMERYFVPNLPERSSMRHDVWRIRRLYNPAADKLFIQHKGWLKTLFQQYCDYTYEYESKSGKKHFTKKKKLMVVDDVNNEDEANDQNEPTKDDAILSTTAAGELSASSAKTTKKKKKKNVKHGGKSKKKRKKRTFVSELMPLNGWLKLLKDFQFVKNGRISLRDATVLFIYSKMGIVEEIEDRFLFTHMDICSFYEGLARVAEYCRIATMAELYESDHPDHQSHHILKTTNLYFDMEECSPKEKKLRVERVYCNHRKSTIDRMSVFGEEYQETKDSPSLASKLEVMLAHMKVLNRNV